nr:hypothetical protein GCM10017611_75720 [Rhodococcus wratislaviensis]
MTRAVDDGNVPPGFIRSICNGSRRRSSWDAARAHYRRRTRGLRDGDRRAADAASRIIAEKVESGACAIAGVAYKLPDGRAHLQGALGDIGELTD